MCWCWHVSTRIRGCVGEARDAKHALPYLIRCNVACGLDEARLVAMVVCRCPAARLCVGLAGMPSGAARHMSGLATHGKDAAGVRPRVAMECSAWRGQQTTLHVQSVSRWAPSNIGPYSQAKTLAAIVLVSGQIALDPASMLLLGTSAEQQAAQCLRNLEVVPSRPRLYCTHWAS